MRWNPAGPSDDLEDRRGQGGGGFRLGGKSIGGIGALVLLALSLIFKQDFFALLGSADSGAPAAQDAPVRSTPREDREVQFVSFVLDDVQKTWDRTLRGYQHARLVLFREATQSGCGYAQAAVGPFYCPTDEKVYLDLSFFDELASRFGAPGEFAQAYVIAHEVGHHLQHQRGLEPPQSNAASVRFELQADCLAGVWAHSTEQRQILEKGDVESAMRAAAAVGDDRLQRQASGRVRPETWTHGSSEQRVDAFVRGMKSGRPEACDNR